MQLISCYIGDSISSYMTQLGKIEGVVAELNGFSGSTETWALVSDKNGFCTYQENLEALRCPDAPRTIAGYIPPAHKQLIGNQESETDYLGNFDDFFLKCEGASIFPILCPVENTNWILQTGKEEKQKIIQKKDLGIELAQRERVPRYTLLYPFKEQNDTHLLLLRFDSRLLGATIDSIEKTYE